MLRMLIADDHSVVRQGMVQILKLAFPEIEIDQAKNSAEVLGCLRKHSYDAIILDISMPGRNGLDILTDLKAVRPEIPVIIFSIYSEDQYAIQALKSGASAYLMKDCEPDELILVLKKVLRGKLHFSERVFEKLVMGLNAGGNGSPQEILSPRELEVMQLIARGKRLSEIAEMLSISASSVSTHRRRILKKLALKNNAQIVRYAIEQKMDFEGSAG